MDSDSRFVITPRTVLGLSIMLLGVLLTLDRLGIAHIDNLFRGYWPVPIMIMGGLMLVQAQDGRERTRGIVFSVIGAWLFLNMQGLVSIRLWELFWPLMLVLIGLSMATRSGRSRWGRRRFGPDGPFGPRGPLGPDGPLGPNGRLARRARRYESRFGAAAAPVSGAASAPGTEDGGSASGRPGDVADEVSMFAVWSSTRRTSGSANFQGGDITAIMGGVQLDLRLAAIPAGKDAVLDVTAVMGGVEIFVPNTWEVSTPVFPFMGAVEDERLPPIQTDPSNPRAASGRLIIRGFVMMGGVHIKS